jgi:hypothetical protein
MSIWLSLWLAARLPTGLLGIWLPVHLLVSLTGLLPGGLLDYLSRCLQFKLSGWMNILLASKLVGKYVGWQARLLAGWLAGYLAICLIIY